MWVVIATISEKYIEENYSFYEITEWDKYAKYIPNVGIISFCNMSYKRFFNYIKVIITKPIEFKRINTK
jgi:hypothetical protein